MSEKKAKQKRKAQKEADELQKKAGEQVLFQVVATVLRNGNVMVGGFPANLNDALMVAGDINKAIVTHFVQQASAGNVDSRGVIIKNPETLPNKHAGISKMQKPETDTVEVKKG